ncbi:hypothetical protein AWB74_08186 [Caballeronia arvi]|uniref:Uncharacterized protein n=1 Tax=Caballeronia arvi TaxID=1777135 RepID=A0A158L2I3_9BURK|nr:hypothetical protein [Caballeronia arvi]SAL87608.1 hypothetical protein AWB74_08186 [Caballeronia arvi]
MKEVVDVWFINERTASDWVLFGFRFDDRVGVGTLTDAALAELFLRAGSHASDNVVKDLFLRAVRNYMCEHKSPAMPSIGSPLDFS